MKARNLNSGSCRPISKKLKGLPKFKFLRFVVGTLMQLMSVSYDG